MQTKLRPESKGNVQVQTYNESSDRNRKKMCNKRPKNKVPIPSWAHTEHIKAAVENYGAVDVAGRGRRTLEEGGAPRRP